MMFSEGQIIVNQGERAPYLYCLYEGQLLSSHKVNNSTQNFNFILNSGDIFGELAIFSDTFQSFSTVTVVSPHATLKKFYLPLVFQYFKCNPVIALRWYCLTGNRISYLLRQIDLFSETKFINTQSVLSTNIDVEETENSISSGYSSLLFKDLFPDLIEQHVFYECNAMLQGSLRSRSVVLYITTDYFCFYFDRGQGTREVNIFLFFNNLFSLIEYLNRQNL